MLSIDPSVGRHLCFERDKKRYRGTKKRYHGTKKRYRGTYRFYVKAQVCDKTVYQHGKCFIFLKYPYLRFITECFITKHSINNGFRISCKTSIESLRLDSSRPD